jgi:hypothetical protein
VFAIRDGQVEVKDLRAETGNIKELRRRLARLESQESVVSKRVVALEAELELKTSDNAGLSTQVRCATCLCVLLASVSTVRCTVVE